MIPRLGVGLQYNPEIMDWFPFEELEVDAMEVLLDTIMGPLDSPYVMKPGAKEKLERLATRYRLIAHSNYGCDFGFQPIDDAGGAAPRPARQGHAKPVDREPLLLR